MKCVSSFTQLFRQRHPERLAREETPKIIGDVFIDPTANVHPSAVVRNSFDFALNSQRNNNACSEKKS